MSEKQKPDGWVAWHPEKGFRTLTNEVSEFYSKMAFLRAWDGQCSRYEVISKFLAFEHDGWRIRPVKILFLDEVKDG